MDAKTFEVTRSEEERRRLLTPEQYAVMRGHGTERPGSCALNFEKRAGAFFCAGCGQPLFVSKTKFESGTGWPSFNQPVAGSTETSEETFVFRSRAAARGQTPRSADRGADTRHAKNP